MATAAGARAKGRTRASTVRYAALVAVVGACWGVVAFADQQQDNVAAVHAALRSGGGASVILCFYPVKQGRHVVCETVGEISRIFPSSAAEIGRLVDARAEQWARAQLGDLGNNPLASLRGQFVGCAGQAPNRAGVTMGMADLTWTIGGDPTGQVGTCSSAATPSLLGSSLGAFWQTADAGATYVDNLIAERQACLQSGQGARTGQGRQQAGGVMGDPDQGNPGSGGGGNQDSGGGGGGTQQNDGFHGDDGGRRGSIWTPTTTNPQNSNDTPARFESAGESRAREWRTTIGRMLKRAYYLLGMESSRPDSGAGSAGIGGRGYCLEGMDCAAASSCAGQAHGRAMAKALVEHLVHSCNANVMPTPEGPTACVAALGGQTLSEAELTQLKRETCELMQGMMGGGGDLVYTGCQVRTAPDIAAARRVGCADPAAMCTAEQNIGSRLPAQPGVRAGRLGAPGASPNPNPDPNPDPTQTPDPFDPPK